MPVTPSMCWSCLLLVKLCCVFPQGNRCCTVFMVTVVVPCSLTVTAIPCSLMVTVVVPCSLTVTVIPCSFMVTVVVPCFCVSAIATLLHVSSWDLLCLAFVFLPPLHCCMFPLSSCCTLLLCFRHSYTAVVVGMHSLYKQCKQTVCACVCVCVQDSKLWFTTSFLQLLPVAIIRYATGLPKLSGH